MLVHNFNTLNGVDERLKGIITNQARFIQPRYIDPGFTDVQFLPCGMKEGKVRFNPQVKLIGVTSVVNRSIERRFDPLLSCTQIGGNQLSLVNCGVRPEGIPSVHFCQKGFI